MNYYFFNCFTSTYSWLKRHHFNKTLVIGKSDENFQSADGTDSSIACRVRFSCQLVNVHYVRVHVFFTRFYVDNKKHYRLLPLTLRMSDDDLRKNWEEVTS